MNLGRLFHRWFDIRPAEIKRLWISFAGAFLVIAFMIMARSLREAFYLISFDVKTLPYIIIATALLSLPIVAGFSKMLILFSTHRVLKFLLVILSLGLGILLPLTSVSKTAVVLFYLWTALGTILLSSGFWILIAELFPLRGAKRLFGFISAGGTLGGMAVGISLGWFSHTLSLAGTAPALIGFLLIFFIILLFLPQLPQKKEKPDLNQTEGKVSILEGFRQILKTHHLMTIALIVAGATLATTLLDYQFKELVRGSIASKEGLASYFGAFYGWTGALAFILQLTLTPRLLSKYGIGWTLAILPLILLLGSLGLLVIPGLILVTLVRGFDYSLRRSLHRSVLEVLFVPISSLLRRKTKIFIDSSVDSIAAGVGAVIIFLWVTWGNFPSRYLSVGVLGLAALLLYLAREMNREYFQTLVGRLKEKEQSSRRYLDRGEQMVGRDLLSASFTSIDLEESLKERGIVFQEPEETKARPKNRVGEDPVQLLGSRNPRKIAKALEMQRQWSPGSIPQLIRILPWDNFYPTVTYILANMGEDASKVLGEYLLDPSQDFVIRRRIPRIMAQIASAEAEDYLLKALVTQRFEIRYRAGIALIKRRKAGLRRSGGNWQDKIWEAIRLEVQKEKAVWEMQQILDELDESETDGFISEKVGLRGEMSLQHTFRLLTLVLDPVAVRAAFLGILLNNEKLKSFALEYIENVLPKDILDKLWLFIGDMSEHQRLQSQRPVQEVVADLVKTGASLFSNELSKEAIRRALEESDEKEKK